MVAAHEARKELRNPLRMAVQRQGFGPSSPIGTFAGHTIGRSSSSLRSSHIEPSKHGPRFGKPNTIGLAPLDCPSRLRAGSRGKHIQTTDTGAHNENADVRSLQGRSVGKATKRVIDDTLSKSRRRRTKIQRVELGGKLLSPSADEPLSDVDHHLNSQPEAADQCLTVRTFDAADESEISYFPTLLPVQPSPAESRDGLDHTHMSHRNAAKNLVAGITCLDAQLEDGDASVGLLDMLSQSAMRTMDGLQKAQAAPSMQEQPGACLVATAESSRSANVQHQVQVDFDPTYYTTTQAWKLATSLVTREVERNNWTAVHPDLVQEQLLSKMHSTGPARIIRPAFRPPSAGMVCQDLGLSLKQMQRSALTDVPDFAQNSRCDAHVEAQCHDEQDLPTFEHRLRFSGYCQRYRTHSKEDAHDLPVLQPLEEAAFERRRQTRRKEVVKVIVPFSEPSLSAHATRARFVAAHATAASPPDSHASSDQLLLVWMQSTAHAFFRALDSMMHAGFARSTPHSSNGLHRPGSIESVLYPSPILHYAAHIDGLKVPSHVALYVHLDRLEEARHKLARIELNIGGEASYKPFEDPDVRLLVTSLGGEPLCLI